MPRALLVYPEFPPSYWGFRYALEPLGKRTPMARELAAEGASERACTFI